MSEATERRSAPASSAARPEATERDAASSGATATGAPSAAAVRGALRDAGVDDVALHLFDELPSTNRWLEENLAGIEASRALCAADRQSEGRARRERSWVSRRGDVALSLLTRPTGAPSRLAPLSLVTGVAVASVLRERCGLDVRIKWPNDIVIGGAKLGGLLATMQPCPLAPRPASASTEPRFALVSGIGLNLRHDERLAALGIGGTSLEAEGVSGLDRDTLLGQLAARVLTAHERCLREGWAAFAAEWRELDWLAGQAVDVHGRGGVERGTALGVHEDGSLRVRIDGAERALYGGEVSVRPRGGRAP